MPQPKTFSEAMEIAYDIKGRVDDGNIPSFESNQFDGPTEIFDGFNSFRCGALSAFSFKITDTQTLDGSNPLGVFHSKPLCDALVFGIADGSIPVEFILQAGTGKLYPAKSMTQYKDISVNAVYVNGD